MTSYFAPGEKENLCGHTKLKYSFPIFSQESSSWELEKDCEELNLG